MRGISFGLDGLFSIFRKTSNEEAVGAPTRVLIVADANGPTQAISFSRPLAPAVAAGEATIELVHEAQLRASWPAALHNVWRRVRPTHVVMSRYAGGGHELIAQMARKTDAAIVYHIDDDLFSVPRELGEDKFRRYNDPSRLAALAGAISASDLIYASTPELGRQLSLRFPGKQMFSGEIYCALPIHRRAAARASQAGTLTIGYMGTSGHVRDLALVVPALINIMDGHPDIRFETFGTIKLPSELERFNGRVIAHPPTSDYSEFLRRLAGLDWDVGLAPIIDSPFNRCKADTKWVEYTAAGIPVVASALPVYEKACRDGAGWLVKDQEWQTVLEHLISDPARRSELAQKAQQRLDEIYSDARLQDQVRRVLEAARAPR